MPLSKEDINYLTLLILKDRFKKNQILHCKILSNEDFLKDGYFTITCTLKIKHDKRYESKKRVKK